MEFRIRILCQPNFRLRIQNWSKNLKKALNGKQTFEPNLIVTSPFRRCLQTAAIFAKFFNHENSESTKIDKIVIDPRLGEASTPIFRCIQEAIKKTNGKTKFTGHRELIILLSFKHI